MFNFFGLLLKFVSLILGISDTQNFPPPLKADEERELFLKMKDGDGEARASS